jgi:soluble lytic murein transglycosylase
LAASSVALALDQDGVFLAARDAFQKGHFSDLDELTAKLEGHPLHPYARYWQLKARLSEVTPAEVAAFLSQHPDSLTAHRLRADVLKQLAQKQDWAAFQSGYANLGLDEPELTCFALQGRLARGDATALADARPLWMQGQPQPESCAPVFNAMIAQGLITEGDVWARIRLALEAGNVSFAKLINGHLPAGRRLEPHRLDAAARNPQRYLDKRPFALGTRGQREIAIFAAWRLAQSLPMVAANRLERFQSQLPAGERAYAWAQVAVSGAMKHRPEALEWYRRAGELTLNDRQLAWKARIALRTGDWPVLISAVDAMSPLERQFSGWRYWKARALLAQGHAIEANQLLAPLAFEHSFYGQLAAEEMGVSDAAVPEPQRLSADEVAAVERVPGIERAVRLYQLGLRYEGALEWRWTTRNFGDRELLAAAEIARRAGWYERAIDTAERTREHHDFTQRFPAPYREVVGVYARQLELDEAWVFGLMRQESRFEPQARSTAGAQGLMQLMPGTARRVARRLGLPGYARSHVIQVDTNINLGTFHLRELLDSFDNQALLASAAYNAGASRARDWRAARPLEGAAYAETIPFTETRDYVRKVMNNTMYYARLFGQPFVPLKLRLNSVAERPLANE